MARENIIEFSIERAKEHYGRNAFDSVIYVGDAEWDMIAARKLGIGFVGVTIKTFSEKLISTVNDFSKPTEFIRLLDSVDPLPE
jgi:phosphoglycolate phosphatase-like HAD superfamily hydrolase